MPAFFDRRRVVERKRWLAHVGGRLPHALGAHDGHGGHTNGGGDACETGRGERRVLPSARDYFRVKTNIAAPAGNSSTSGHSAG